MAHQNFPTEIAYKILSYLPSQVLNSLNLSNRQYWEIYRTTVDKASWDEETIWFSKLLKTNEMLLSDQLYVQSLFSIEVGYLPDTYTPKVPVENGLVVFKPILDGYVWHPSNKPINFADIKQVLNENDTTAPPFSVDNGCDTDGKILDVFNKHLFKYVTSCIPSHEGYESEEWTDEEGTKKNLLALKCNLGRKCKRKTQFEKLHEFPDDMRFEIPLVLYIQEEYLDLAGANFVNYKLEFVDKLCIYNFIVWKVLKNKRDIGRAVLSPVLHAMMEKYIIGIALFANEKNVVYGFGNFNYGKLEKSMQESSVFKKHNFAIVKENIHNREPIEQWLVDARHAGTV